MEIYKDTKTGKYGVKFKDMGGRIRSRSLQTSSRDEAKRLVSEAGIAQLEHAAQAGTLTAEVIGMIVAGKRVTCEQVYAGWSEWLGKYKSTSTVNTFTAYVNAFLRELGAWKWVVPKITADHVDKFVNEPETKLNNRKVRVHAIRSFFNYATANAYTMVNPSLLVKIRKKDMSVELKEEAKRVPITVGEYRKILSETTEFWRWATVLSYWTGLRLTDICCLEWSSIRRDAILVYTRKDEDRIWLPLSNPNIGSPDLKEALMEMTFSCTGSKEYVFPEYRKIMLSGKRAKLSVYYTRLLKKIGIEGKSFHCLRHSFATRLKHAGVSIEEIATHMGHSSTKLTSEVYAH